MTAEAEPGTTQPPGAWPAAILEQARESLGDQFAQLGGQSLEMTRPWTLDEIAAFIAEFHPLPPTELHCHPSVLAGLAQVLGDPADWPSRDRPDLVRIEIYTNDEMADGAWELRRGDEVVDRGVIT